MRAAASGWNSAVVGGVVAALGCAAAWGAALAGCSRGIELLPVGGYVTLDGKPLENASVLFVREGEQGPAPFGVTDQAGRFELVTVNERGAPPGSYRVIVNLVEVTGNFELGADDVAPSAEAAPVAKTVVPLRYAAADTSGLTAEVAAGQQEFEFQLTGR